MNNEIPLGIYRHFKGNDYVVLGNALHSETMENMVIYRRCNDDRSGCNGALWVRPASMWFDDVEYNGKICKRFEKLMNEKVIDND